MISVVITETISTRMENTDEERPVINSEIRALRSKSVGPIIGILLLKKFSTLSMNSVAVPELIDSWIFESSLTRGGIRK
jgi:hypothetical protein